MLNTVIEKPLLEHEASFLKSQKNKISEKNIYLIINNYLLKIDGAVNKKDKSINVIKTFFKIKKINIKISPEIIKNFDNEFFEEIPEGHAKMPFELIDNWYKRFKKLTLDEY